MFEISTDRRYRAAYAKAHDTRAAAFAEVFGPIFRPFRRTR